MRNIRIADRRDWVVNQPSPRPRSRTTRAKDWLSTFLIVLLVPALVTPFLRTSAGGPALAISPDTATAASVVVVEATGLAKNERGTLTWNGDGTGMPSYQANAKGSFRMRLTVPSNAPAGSHEVATLSRDGETTARALLQVVATAAIGPIVEPRTEPEPAPSATAPPSEEPASTSTPTPSQSSSPAPVAPSATPTPAPTATPTPTPAPTPTPTPAPTATPAPTPTPTPAPTTTSCGTSLQAKIDAAASGSTLNLTGCTYTSGATIGKPLTLVGATIAQSTTSGWSFGITIRSNFVTLSGITIRDGGAGVAVLGSDRVVIRSSVFRSLYGSSIAIYHDGRGTDDLLVEGNVIRQTRSVAGTSGQAGVSPIIGRSTTDTCGGGKNLRTIFRNNDIDQGSRPDNVGWFGVELFCSEAPVFEGNRFKGGHALVSIPRTDNAVFRGNYFDMSGNGAYWGIELATASRALVERNVFDGIVLSGTRHGISYNSGASYSTVRYNQFHDLSLGLGISGTGHLVTDSCTANVTRFYDTYGGTLSGSTIHPPSACS